VKVVPPSSGRGQPPDVPDYIEPIIGWRVWYAVDDGVGTSLSSVVHRTLWPRGAPLVASCRRFRVPLWPFQRQRHDAPASDCKCGIYAVKVPSLRLYLPETLAWTELVPVVGRVFLWGSVHEHAAGWRAERAYPESLFVPIAELGRRRAIAIMSDLSGYGVPVQAVEAGTADGVLDEVSSLAA
jgi:hypothetical protein